MDTTRQLDLKIEKKDNAILNFSKYKISRLVPQIEMKARRTHVVHSGRYLIKMSAI
jgi:hypothetical protein